MQSPSSIAEAGAIADFYDGKSVKLVVSAGGGSGYDTYARLIVRHMQAFIPGNPDMVVQNMPGAGGIKAGNYLYRQAEQNGTVIGSLQNNVPFEPLLGATSARFNSLAFNWLGSPNSEVGLLLVWHSVPVDSLSDATKRRLVVGSSGASSTPAFHTRILNAVLGTQLKPINGYSGQAEALQAMEQGEVDGYPGSTWGSLKTMRPDWISERQVKVLLQYGERPHPDLPGVPMARDMAQSDGDRQLLDAAMAPLTIGRPYLAPPNVPAPRVAALRAALMGTFRDVAFMVEAEKLRLDVDLTPQTGEDIRQVLMRTYTAPKAVLQRLASLYYAGARQTSSSN